MTIAETNDTGMETEAIGKPLVDLLFDIKNRPVNQLTGSKAGSLSFSKRFQMK